MEGVFGETTKPISDGHRTLARRTPNARNNRL
jgi:hypothetical protein